ELEALKPLFPRNNLKNFQSKKLGSEVEEPTSICDERKVGDLPS
ncbi:11445_t:CDS:1, partial [Ambispora leptoticha]